MNIHGPSIETKRETGSHRRNKKGLEKANSRRLYTFWPSNFFQQRIFSYLLRVLIVGVPLYLAQLMPNKYLPSFFTHYKILPFFHSAKLKNIPLHETHIFFVHSYKAASITIQKRLHVTVLPCLINIHSHYRVHISSISEHILHEVQNMISTSQLHGASPWHSNNTGLDSLAILSIIDKAEIKCIY